MERERAVIEEKLSQEGPGTWADEDLTNPDEIQPHEDFPHPDDIPIGEVGTIYQYDDAMRKWVKKENTDDDDEESEKKKRVESKESNVSVKTAESETVEQSDEPDASAVASTSINSEILAVDVDNCSDISDADDDILNREEPEEVERDIPIPEDDMVTQDEILENEEAEHDGDDSADELWQVMDVEEISDDELSENGTKTGIVDALEVDWSSLISTRKKQTEKSSSALSRFSASNIFSRIGVSAKFAGPDLMKEINEKCKAEMKSADCKQEFVLHDDVAMLHVATMKKIRDKAKLVTDIGSYRQALSASRDLSIRRRLCQLSDKEMGFDVTGAEDIFKLRASQFRTRSCA